MAKKKKQIRSAYVMVNMTPDEYKALKAYADGEPLGRTLREVAMRKILKSII